jgi:hypothetical protein
MLKAILQETPNPVKHYFVVHKTFYPFIIIIPRNLPIDLPRLRILKGLESSQPIGYNAASNLKGGEPLGHCSVLFRNR